MRTYKNHPEIPYDFNDLPEFTPVQKSENPSRIALIILCAGFLIAFLCSGSTDAVKDSTSLKGLQIVLVRDGKKDTVNVRPEYLKMNFNVLKSFQK